MLPVPRSWSEVTPAWMTQALQGSYPGVVVEETCVDEVSAGTTNRGAVRLAYARGGGPARVFVKREGTWFNRLAVTALGRERSRPASPSRTSSFRWRARRSMPAAPTGGGSPQ